MRISGVSTSDVCGYGVSGNTFSRYISVKKAVSKADKMASSQRVTHRDTQLPAFSFDPIMDDVIHCCEKNGARCSLRVDLLGWT